MKIRVFISILLLLPIFFLFGLDNYLERYEQHSKYLSKLRDSLIIGLVEKDIVISNSSAIISGIDEGDFSKVSACLRAGNSGGELCLPESSIVEYKNISNLELLKGMYKDRSGEYIDDFKKNIVIGRGELKNYPTFDYEFNFISDNDIDSWQRYNNDFISKRYRYYSSLDKTTSDSKSWYINGGSVFEPSIYMSNVSPNNSERIRVLAVSDSFGYGNGLMSIDDTWARELESQLNQIEDKYEVIVLAYSGAGYKDYLKWIKDGYVEAIDPDMVLVSFFRNDFNLLATSGVDANTYDEKIIKKLRLAIDEEFVFYLRCFEKEDDFFGRVLKKFNQAMPNLYRYYKFRNCGESLSRLNSKELVNHNEIVSSYKEIDRLITVPTFLYQIESSLKLDTSRSETLKAINENGLNFIVNSNSNGLVNNNNCLNVYSINFLTCRDFKANFVDGHFNRFYSKSFIESNINEIKKSIDRYVGSDFASRENKAIENKSEAIIVDFIPNTLFVSNVDKGSAMVGFLKGKSYGYGRNSENFCVPFNRKGVIINFNRYLTEGKEIKISSEFQRDGLGLVSRGYDKDGRVVFGEAIELKAGSPITFIGSESVRGVVVLSNNRDCGRRDTKIEDEFLLQVKVL